MKIEYERKNVSNRTNEGLFNAPYVEKLNSHFLKLNGRNKILFKKSRNLLFQNLHNQLYQWYIQFQNLQVKFNIVFFIETHGCLVNQDHFPEAAVGHESSKVEGHRKVLWIAVNLVALGWSTWGVVCWASRATYWVLGATSL